MGAAPRWFAAGLVAIIMTALLLSACGGSEHVDESAAMAQPPSAATSGGSAAGSTSGGAAAEATQTDSGSASLQGEWDRRIIRSAELTLTVQDVEQALAFVRSTVSGAQGRVLTSSTYFEGESEVASLTLEVPADQFDPVMNALRGSTLVEKVEREVTTSQDVTEEFIDLEARQRNLEATETRFLDLLNQATRMEDILALERELSRVRGEIEQIKGRLNYLDRRTSYSRIDLTLRPTALAAAAESPAFDFVATVSEAWESSLRFVGRVAGAAVTVVVFLWWLWLLGLVAAAGFVAVRGRRRGAPTEGGTTGA